MAESPLLFLGSAWERVFQYESSSRHGMNPQDQKLSDLVSAVESICPQLFDYWQATAINSMLCQKIRRTPKQLCNYAW